MAILRIKKESQAEPMTEVQKAMGKVASTPEFFSLVESMVQTEVQKAMEAVFDPEYLSEAIELAVEKAMSEDDIEAKLAELEDEESVESQVIKGDMPDYGVTPDDDDTEDQSDEDNVASE